MKKKILLLVLVFSFLLVGCKKEENVEENINKETVIVGGWTMDTTGVAQDIDTEVLEIFNKAIEGYTGVGYEAKALLGTQVVAGTNYMFLCKGTSTASETPKTSWYVVVIYNDLDGNAEITKSTEIDISTLKESITTSEVDISGGWTTNTNVVNKLSSPVKEIVDEALATVNTIYTPVILLGTQVVAGTNYAVLAFNPLSNLYNVITIYNDLEGNSSINSFYNFDLADFN